MDTATMSMNTVIGLVGFVLFVGSFAFLIGKPRQNRKPRITIEN